MTVVHLHLVSFGWSMSICICFVNTTLEGLPTLAFYEIHLQSYVMTPPPTPTLWVKLRRYLFFSVAATVDEAVACL